MSESERSEKFQQGQQSFANKVEEQSTVEARYQPIAPFGGVPVNNSNNSQSRRTGRACDECRRKKIKCYKTEGSSSCKNCISYKKGCQFSITTKKRGPLKGYINVLENRLERIEGLISNMSNDVDQNKADSGKEILGPAVDIEATRKERVVKDKLHDEHLASSSVSSKFIYKAISDSHLSSEGRFVSGASVGYIFSRKIKLMDRKELYKLGIELQHDENSDYFHIKKMRTLTEKRSDQINQLLDLGVIQSTTAVNNIDDWIWKVAGIDKALSDRLLKVYFAYIHPLLPVINKVAFLEEYRGIRLCFPAGPLLNAVYGASVRYIDNCRKFGDSDRLDNGEPWDFPANLSEKLFQNLIIFIKGKYKPCLSTIQAIVIAHNHSANVESWTSGWLLNCIAVRMSQDIGLHRSSEGWNIPQQEKETRRMVWWSVYLLDRWFSSGTGRPLTAFDEDCDELYPSENVSLDEIMDKMTEKDQHLPRFPSLDERVASKASDNFIPMNQPFLHLLKLSEILGRILQGLYTPKAKRHSAKHGSDAIVGYLDDALSNWRASLPPLLAISSAGKRNLNNEDHSPLLSMSGLICLSYCTSLILLHRPFIEKESNTTEDSNKNPIPNPPKLSSQSALTICTSAAIRIIEVSESMHYRDFLMVSWGFALYPVFTAALIHIHNSSNPDSIVSDVAKSNLVRAMAVVDKLCLLSPMAASMGNILKKVIAVSSIFVDDPEFVSMVNIRKESEKAAQDQGNATTSKRAEYSGNESSPSSPIPRNTKRMRKSPDGWEPTRDVKVLRSRWFPKDESTGKKSTPESISTPTWDDGSWINQLYTPTQTSFELKDVANENASSTASKEFEPVHYTTQQQYQQQYEHTNNNVDVYSIRQFGLKVMHPSFSAPIDNSHLHHYGHQQEHIQQYNLSQHGSIPSSSHSALPYPNQHTEHSLPTLQQYTNNTAAGTTIPATLFDFSDFSSAYHHESLFNTNPNAIPLHPMGLENMDYSTNLNNTTETSDPSALFRHRPDNPFWGMPSSMELDDWHAYLLPHQQRKGHPK